MDESSAPGGMTRGPIEAIRSTLRNGFNRYKALADARESRALLAAFTISFIGVRMVTVALVVLSYRLGEGALAVGGMIAVQMIPGILFQPLSGSIVDRFPGKRLLVAVQFLLAITMLTYLLLLQYPSIWLLYAIIFVRSMIQTIDTPAHEVRLMLLTPTEKRGTANAVQSLCITFGDVVGPLLGGLFLALFGSTPIFIIAAAIFVVYGLIIHRLPERVEGATRIVDEGSEEEAANTEASRQGYRGLINRPIVVFYLLTVIGSYMLFMGLIPLYIVRAIELGMSEESVGIFYAMLGIGGLIGGILSGMGAYTTRKALVLTGTASAALAFVAIMFGLSGTPILAFAFLIIVGLIGEVEEIPAITYFQNTLPESVYGRFFSLFLVVASLGGLVGSLLAPFLADRYSTIFALTVLGVPGVIFGLLFAIKGGGFRLARQPFAAIEPAIVAVPIPAPENEPIGPVPTDPESAND